MGRFGVACFDWVGMIVGGRGVVISWVDSCCLLIVLYIVYIVVCMHIVVIYYTTLVWWLCLLFFVVCGLWFVVVYVL